MRKEVTGPWAIDEEVKKLIEEAKEEIRIAKENRESRIINSPIDGSPSKLVRYEGSHGRVRAIFRSENGDEFPVG